jgi:vancomycin resistance protein VanJ
MTKPSLLTRLLLGTTHLYGLLITLLLFVRWLTGEQLIFQGFTPVGLFNSFIPMVLLPSVILVPLYVILRRPRAAAIHIPALAVLMVLYGGQFIPRAPQALTNTPSFSVLTYNLHFINTQYDQVIEIIRSADADVVALQEMTSEAAAILTEEFGAEYPYQALYPMGGSTLGCGIFSRYPILEDEAWEDVMMQQRVVLDIQENPVTIFNVHPPIPYLYGANATIRDRVVRRILTRADAVSGAMLIMGDFNMGDASEMYGHVTAQYHDAFKNAGRGFGLSFPDWSWHEGYSRFLPVLARLDYVFYNDELQAVQAWVSHTSGGSDHRPLYAELAIVGKS